MNHSTYSVSALTETIAMLLQDGLGEVRVSGEISGLKRAASGHRYFTLKDEEAQISCVLWQGRKVTSRLTDGMRVIVDGSLTVYAPRGNYQIDCYAITPAGQGDLYLAFEALKQDLAARGFFDLERKRSLPALPLHIGVVTSPTGAAVQDIIATLKRRSPISKVYLCPATVQGDAAPKEIAAAIATLNRAAQCDVMIVGRGGGSLEDLWAFNTLPVAEAIFSSKIPIVSAVGHETDFTIADFVADVRAATPTAAAELVTPQDTTKLMQRVHTLEAQLTTSIGAMLHYHQQNVDTLAHSYAFHRFTDRLHNYAQQIDEAETRLQVGMQRTLEQSQTRLAAVTAHLRSLHPLSPLQRGFALLRSPDDRLIAPDQSLTDFAQVEIVRHQEVAIAHIEQVTQEVYAIGTCED